jgi:hypothetical protein
MGEDRPKGKDAQEKRIDKPGWRCGTDPTFHARNHAKTSSGPVNALVST